MTDVIVTMHDLRKLRYCSKGARAFFIRNGLDWNDFLKNGIPASRLAQLDDVMATKAIEAARGKQ